MNQSNPIRDDDVHADSHRIHSMCLIAGICLKLFVY